ncbi:ATP-binding cassette domain-containing protein [bacterium 3DAC]|nr:ATP-binding cassette domain-containing protein [bacterium 3DAC]
MSEVKVRNLTVKYGNFVAVEDVSFDVPHGLHIALVGPSGCGKSTLLKAVAGLIPYEGSVEGTPERIGYMPQKGVLLPWYTVMKNLTLPLTLRGIPEKEARRKVENHLEEFGLKGFEDKYPSVLSGGMYQRAALLRTLMVEAPLILLDEPFGAVDALNRRRLWLWLEERRMSWDISTIMVTHDVEEAVFLSDTVIILDGPPARIKKVVHVSLPHPRDIHHMGTSQFAHLAEEVLEAVIEK